jgi:predicted enzyme related to lactoylglutathione lyase
MLIALRVNDVDAALKGLNDNGIKAAAEPRDLPALRYAFVQDPNGIRVELVKRHVKP